MLATYEYYFWGNDINEYLLTLEKELIEDKQSTYTIELLNIAWFVWLKLKYTFYKQGLKLMVPDACIGSNNNFMFAWRNDVHYLECEIFANGLVEFFYRNRTTNEVWGEDIAIEQSLTANIIDKVKLFTNSII